jgi:hypothetical protein
MPTFSFAFTLMLMAAAFSAGWLLAWIAAVAPQIEGT